MLLFIGYGIVALGFFAVSWAVVVSYQTQGGSLGQVPVLAQGVQAALLITLGVAIIGSRQAWADTKWWGYLLMFLLLATVFSTSIVQVGRAASRIEK
jgi:hypothetical protein